MSSSRGARPLSGATAAGPGRSRRAAGGLWHLLLFLLVSVLAGVLAAGLALPMAGGAGLAVRETVSGFEGLPGELTEPPLATNATMLAADGTPLATFYENNRVPVTLANIAPVMRQALVAIEDARFYDHGGVDLRGTTRALVNNSSGESVQGGSTITQQYVKRVLLETALAEGDEEAAQAATEREGTAGYQRKLVELRYATALEERLTKDEILERYLNIVYFGNGTYGVEAASRRYFNKPATQLQPQEAAMLAGMVQNPSEYNPFKRGRATTTRRNLVLDRMGDVGYLAPAQVTALKRAPLGLKPGGDVSGCDRSPAPFFCDFVLRSVLEDPTFGATREDRRRLLFRNGVTIRTTLDMSVQRAAERAIAAKVKPSDKVAAVVTSVEPGTGQVKAMAQSRGFGDGEGKTKLNLAVDTARGGSAGAQAGSSFKPYLAAEALRQGFGYNYTIFSPRKLLSVLPMPGCEKGTPDIVQPQYYGQEIYQPENTTPDEHGPYNLQRAMSASINTYFIQLQEQVGLCEPAKRTERMGVKQANGEPLKQVAAWTLGSNNVTPLDMAEGYATFAARGKHCPSITISKLTDRAGKDLPIPQSKCTQELEPEVSDAVTGLLTGVLTNGTASASQLSRPAAGKTGTTNSNVAAWFVGYTPNLSTSVAMWNPSPGRVVYKMEDVTVGGVDYDRIQGGTVPAPIWKATMEAALQDTPAQSFTPVQSRFLIGARGYGSAAPDPARHGVATTPVVPGQPMSPGQPTAGTPGTIRISPPTARPTATTRPTATARPTATVRPVVVRPPARPRQ